MGAWDSDPFGNDTASDWTYGLKDVDDLSMIEEAIQTVLEVGNDYLEAPPAEEAIAAIDILARLQGRFYVKNAYTKSADVWVAAHPLMPSASLIANAEKALTRIISEPSEVLELWQESDDFEAWKTHLENLRKRLR